MGGSNTIAELVLPDSVTSIYDNSFLNVAGLEFGAGLKEIKETSTDFSFQDCFIGNIEVSPENPYYSADGGILYDKDKTKIYAVASKHEFENNTLTIPSTVTELCNPIYAKNVSAFAVEEGNPAFSTLDGVLTDITQTKLVQFPNGNEKRVYAIDEPYESIGKYAFYKSTLQQISFSDSIKVIEENAFANSAAAVVTLPSGLTSIGNRAFYQTQMVGVHIPASVKTIGSEAFYGDNYASLVFDHPANTDIDSFASDLSNCDVFYGYAGSPVALLFPQKFQSIDSAENGSCGTNLKWNLIGNELTISGNGAMHNYEKGAFPWSNKSFSVVKFSGTDIRIADYAFENCTGLYIIDLSHVKQVGIMAFAGCTQLQVISNDDSVENVGMDAVRDTMWWLDPELYDADDTGVAILGSVLLKCDSQATTITIPNQITSIPANVFSNCRVQTLYVPRHGLQYSTLTFENCVSLSHVRWTGSTTDITINEFIAAGKQCKNIQIYDENGKAVTVRGYTKDNTKLSLADALYGTPYMKNLLTSYCDSLLAANNCVAGKSDTTLAQSIYKAVHDSTTYSFCYAEDPYGKVKGPTGTWTLSSNLSYSMSGLILIGSGVCYGYMEYVEALVTRIQEKGISHTLQSERKSGKNHVWNVVGTNVGSREECWYYLDASNSLCMIGYDNAHLSNSPALFSYDKNLKRNQDGTYTIQTVSGKKVRLQGSDFSNNFPHGNVDGKGTIEISDAFLALQISSSISAGNAVSKYASRQLHASDVNADGLVTISDAHDILMYSSISASGGHASWDSIITK